MTSVEGGVSSAIVEEVKRTRFADSTPRHHQHNMSCTRRGLFVALAVLLLGVTLAQAQVR
jgi:hypothetical protein